MFFTVDDYPKSWRQSLITYPTAAAVSLSAQSRKFLQSVGLPLGREPEWNFDGRLLPTSFGLQFGRHGVSPLLITDSDSVIKVLNDEPIYLNMNIGCFAECLTLRDRAFRFGSPIKTIADLRRAIHAADPTATSGETFWGRYLIECDEEDREIEKSRPDPTAE